MIGLVRGQPFDPAGGAPQGTVGLRRGDQRRGRHGAQGQGHRPGGRAFKALGVQGGQEGEIPAVGQVADGKGTAGCCGLVDCGRLALVVGGEPQPELFGGGVGGRIDLYRQGAVERLDGLASGRRGQGSDPFRRSAGTYARALARGQGDGPAPGRHLHPAPQGLHGVGLGRLGLETVFGAADAGDRDGCPCPEGVVGAQFLPHPVDQTAAFQAKIGLDGPVGEAEQVGDGETGVRLHPGVGVVRQDQVGVAVRSGDHGLPGGHGVFGVQRRGAAVGGVQGHRSVDCGHPGGERLDDEQRQRHLQGGVANDQVGLGELVDGGDPSPVARRVTVVPGEMDQVGARGHVDGDEHLASLAGRDPSGQDNKDQGEQDKEEGESRPQTGGAQRSRGGQRQTAALHNASPKTSL